MAQISLSINGRSYQVTCDDGQEPHLQRLGEYFDARVQELAGAVGQVGESRLLVMASLLIADELIETRSQLNLSGGQPTAETATDTAGAAGAAGNEQLDDAAGRALDACARRIEDIALRLESA